MLFFHLQAIITFNDRDAFCSPSAAIIFARASRAAEKKRKEKYESFQ